MCVRLHFHMGTHAKYVRGYNGVSVWEQVGASAWPWVWTQSPFAAGRGQV